jgi:hypothetical protein
MNKLPSTFGTLNIRDFVKGFVLAVIVPALLAVQQSLASGELTIDWKALGITSLASFIGYLLKNYFTNDVAAAVKIVEEAEQKQVTQARL